MKIKSCPCGVYQTNCYIVTIDGKDLIIDPGQKSKRWVLQYAHNPIAILNTHGHFDHVWDNAKLQSELQIPLYTPQDDAFMLESDPLGRGTPISHPDHKVPGNTTTRIAGIDVRWHLFPGHTPGTSVLEIEGHWFSGDFLFRGSIGRWDFPYSSGSEMIRSLQRARQITEDYPLHPGHGPSTTLRAEQKLMNYWIETVKASIS